MASRLHLDLARHALASGGVVAYPTEGVWGLGCEPLNRHAVARLLALKRRPQMKGLIVIAADFAQVERFTTREGLALRKRALDTWPGAATWLFPASAGAPAWLTGAHGTIALRVTAHPVAAALCRAYGGAIVSTSANVAGRAAARTALGVRRCFGAALDYILAGDTGGLARPTPIRDLGTGKLLRA